MGNHALLSPSSAKQRALCPGSLAMQTTYPQGPSSKYAAEGTAAHELADMCLKAGANTEAYRGRIIKVEGHEFEVGDEMVEHVQTYLDNVRDYAGHFTLLPETKVSHGSFIDVNEHLAWGTSDAIVIGDDEIQVHDLKYGRGILVSPVENLQAIAYALGALAAVRELLGDISDYKRVRVVIHQPRSVKAPAEWDVTVEDLLGKYAPALRASEDEALRLHRMVENEMFIDPEVNLIPGEDQCRFCSAFAHCPSARKKVAFEVAGEFDALDGADPLQVTQPADAWQPAGGLLLGVCLQSVEFIRNWCNAIESAAEAALHRGESVPGFKLVEGKRGNRAWGDAAEAEAAMKAMRLKVDEMYNMKLISPTDATKLLKDNPKRLATVQALIVQADGKPTVAPEADKRPALVVTPPEDEFDDMTDEADGLA